MHMHDCHLFDFGCRDFTRPDLPSGEQTTDLSGSAAGPGSPAGVPDLTTAIASKQLPFYFYVLKKVQRVHTHTALIGCQADTSLFTFAEKGRGAYMHGGV